MSTEGAKPVGGHGGQAQGLQAGQGRCAGSECRNGWGQGQWVRKVTKGLRLARWSCTGGTRVSCGLGGTGTRMRWDWGGAWNLDLGAREAGALAESTTQTLKLPRLRT